MQITIKKERVSQGNDLKEIEKFRLQKELIQ